MKVISLSGQDKIEGRKKYIVQMYRLINMQLIQTLKGSG